MEPFPHEYVYPHVVEIKVPKIIACGDDFHKALGGLVISKPNPAHPENGSLL